MLNKFNAADLVIRAALTGLTSLRHVSLRCVDTLSDDTLVSIAMTVPELQYLDVGQCSRITDEGVSAVSRHCGRLTHLDLAFTRITDAALKGLNRGGTLTTLVLTECSDVEALPFNTASLTSFSVGGLTAIPPEWLTGAIQPLIHHATTLEVCGKQSASVLCAGARTCRVVVVRDSGCACCCCCCWRCDGCSYESAHSPQMVCATSWALALRRTPSRCDGALLQRCVSGGDHAVLRL